MFFGCFEVILSDLGMIKGDRESFRVFLGDLETFFGDLSVILGMLLGTPCSVLVVIWGCSGGDLGMFLNDLGTFWGGFGTF